VPDPSRHHLDISQPRTVADILITALRLFVRYPLLFLALAVVVVVPYDLLILGVTGASPLGQGSTSTSTTFLVALLDFALVGPLVSALQVHAVLDIGEGVRPKLLELLRRGLRVLPVVAAAEIIADIGIGIGLVLLIIPGIILALRFGVVAQVAAVERTDWPGALRRSARLVAGNYLRVFGLLFVVALVNLLLVDLVAQLAGRNVTTLQVVLGIVIGVLTRTFQAIATAVLYFDLRAREAALTRSVPPS
jgi:hypothetical protein